MTISQLDVIERRKHYIALAQRWIKPGSGSNCCHNLFTRRY